MISNPTAPNPNTLMADLRMKSDKQLFDYAQMHKNDPYIFPMVFQESNARKKLRAAQKTQAPPAPKVVDQNLEEMAQPMPEDQGIATLPAPNMQNMAGGGIVAFDDGGEVPGYAEGGFRKPDRKQEFAAKYRDAAVLAGQELGVDPGIIISQWGLETGWGKSIIPGTNNLGNIKDFSGKGVKAYDKEEKSNDRYRQYESPEAFAKDYISLIKRKYPDSVGTGGDAKKFVAGLGAGKPGGYATDKSYASKFLNTVGSFLPIATATAPEIDKPTATAAPAPTTNQTLGKGVRTQAEADALFKKQMQDVKNVFTSSTPPSAAQDQGIAALTSDPMTGFTMPQDVFSPSPEEERKYAAAQAQAKKVGDVVSQIPGQSVKAPAFKDTNTYFGSVADELGIPQEVQRNAANTINATSGFTAPVGGINRAASTVSKGLEPTAEMIQKAEQARQVADTVRLLPPTKAGLEGLDAASAAARAGAEQARRMRLLEQDRKAAIGAEQSVDAATKSAAIADKFAKEQAMLVDAARLGQAKMTGAAQGLAMTQAADKAGLFPQDESGIGALRPNDRIGESVFDPTFGGKMPLPADKAKVESEGLSIKDLPKDPVTSGTDWHKLMLQMGLHLMAGKSPNLLTNIGEAGLGTLAMQQAEKKSTSEAEYRRALGRYYEKPSAAIQELEWARDPENMKLLRQIAQAKADPKTSSAEALGFLKDNGLILKELDPVMYKVLRNKVLGYAVPQVQEVEGTRS
jgi:flagellum-specific peptidoglycan hydrolase FlgJ